MLLQITATRHRNAFHGHQNWVRENDMNRAPLRRGLPGCSFGGHQSKVLITRLLCFGALAEAGPDASSNVCFFLSPFVSQAKYPKISSFMREEDTRSFFCAWKHSPHLNAALKAQHLGQVVRHALLPLKNAIGDESVTPRPLT